MLATTARGDAYTFAEYQGIFALRRIRINLQSAADDAKQAAVSFKGAP